MRILLGIQNERMIFLRIVKFYITNEEFQKMITDKFDEMYKDGQYKDCEILLKSVKTDLPDLSIEFECYIAPKWDSIYYSEDDFKENGFNAIRRYKL